MLNLPCPLGRFCRSPNSFPRSAERGHELRPSALTFGTIATIRKVFQLSKTMNEVSRRDFRRAETP